jgi:hypothetical protein
VRPLLDREAELAVLRSAVAAVAGGAGRSVVVVGAPGAGKTSLLDEARTLAERAGLRVLSARGDELEHEHPYGLVRQLFETALLGPERAPWLSGPASAAASVFLPESSVEAAPFATLSGLHWLTANAAADGPLALVVDDLHWGDPPSLHVLHYVLRRSEGLPALLVLGGRPGEVDRLVDAAPPSAGTVLRPAPLSLEAAGHLTQQLLGVRPAEGFAAAAWRATAGNPLLLVELLRALRAEGITPDDASIDLIDRVGPPALARVVLVRLRRLPADALAVAQAIALLGTGAATSLVAELAGLEEPAVLRAVALLVDAEVIDAQPPLGFVHPIVREAVYREVAPDQRDRLHALAAELLHRRAAAPDEVGAQLLLAAPRGLPWVIDTLQAAAADASQRGAVETAITFLRRAVAERPADANPRLLLRLGLTETAVDPAAAVAHLAMRVAGLPTLPAAPGSASSSPGCSSSPTPRAPSPPRGRRAPSSPRVRTSARRPSRSSTTRADSAGSGPRPIPRRRPPPRAAAWSSRCGPGTSPSAAGPRRSASRSRRGRSSSTRPAGPGRTSRRTPCSPR